MCLAVWRPLLASPSRRFRGRVRSVISLRKWKVLGRSRPGSGGGISFECNRSAHAAGPERLVRGAVGGWGRSIACTSTIATGDPCQLGSVFPDASVVYFRHWCVIVECDGPSLMFVYACWYVSGLGGACYSPHWCCMLCMLAKTIRFLTI